MNVDNLLNKARQVLDDAANMESRLESAEQYVQEFTSWHESFDAGAELSAELRAQLEELSELHGKVLAFVEKLREDSVQELRGFRSRAKGIMAYTDRLPRRISLAAKRKG